MGTPAGKQGIATQKANDTVKLSGLREPKVPATGNSGRGTHAMSQHHAIGLCLRRRANISLIRLSNLSKVVKARSGAFSRLTKDFACPANVDSVGY